MRFSPRTVGLLSAVTGLSASACPVIWKWQTAPQPGTPYVALSLGAFITEGFDYTLETCAPDWQPTTAYAVGARVLNDTGPRTYTCITAGTSARVAGDSPSGRGMAGGAFTAAPASSPGAASHGSGGRCRRPCAPARRPAAVLHRAPR